MTWIARHRRLVLAFISVFWVGAVVAALWNPDAPFLSAVGHGEQTFGDLLRRDGRKTPTRDDLVFVGIDQQSLQLDVVSAEEIAASPAFQLMSERPFPWSRKIWPLLLDRLFAAGARLVIFDMIFNPENDGDPAFAEALNRYRDRVVIGLNYDAQAGALIGPNATLIPAPAGQDDRVGLVNFWADPIDGKVRAARFFISDRQLVGWPPAEGEPIYASLTSRGLKKLGLEKEVPNDLEAHPFRFSAADAYQPIELWKIFLDSSWQGNLGGGAAFKDKIVIVGASAQVLHDVVDTPMSPSTPGPVLHLHALAAAMAREYLSYGSASVGYVSLAGAGLLAWGLIAFLRRPLLELIAVVALALGYLLLARVLYDTQGLFILTVPVLVAFVGSSGSALGLDYVLERREKLKTRRTLERYVSKNLVKDILDNPASFYSTMKGARIPVTVLFSDLIGFTTLSERADPEELVRQLNEYLSKMVGVVFANEGTLDKFIGDAIMAVWGNVQSAGPAADAKACARAGLGMRQALVELNEGWRKEGRMTLGMGVGINHGDVLAGNIGSGDRADLTVIGDSVNLASRLEALTRNYGVDLLVGEGAVALIKDDFHLRSVARVQVKGKTIPVSISTLLCEKGADYDGEFLKWLESYEEGIVKFRGREFAGARALFERFLEVYPKDVLTKNYLERALEYEKNPPDENWNAAEVFTKK